MAEKDCAEVGFAKKSKPAAGEKVRERQIGICGGKTCYELEDLRIDCAIKQKRGIHLFQLLL